MAWLSSLKKIYTKILDPYLLIAPPTKKNILGTNFGRGSVKHQIDKDKAFHTINQRKYWPTWKNVNIETVFRNVLKQECFPDLGKTWPIKLGCNSLLTSPKFQYYTNSVVLIFQNIQKL